MLNNGCCRLSVYGDRRFTISWDDVFIKGPTDMRISNVIVVILALEQTIRPHKCTSSTYGVSLLDCKEWESPETWGHEVYNRHSRQATEDSVHEKWHQDLELVVEFALARGEQSVCVCVCASRCVPQRGTLPRRDQCKWARLHAHVRVSVWGGGKLISQCFC